MFFLGTITGASGAYYNNVTGVSGFGAFSIPVSAKSVYLVPSASGLQFCMGVATGPTGPGPNFANLNNTAQLAGPGQINGPFRLPPTNYPTILGIYAQGATLYNVRVFGAPTS